MEAIPQLTTPEEELAYLRAQVAEKEAALASSQGIVEREKVISEQLYEHHAAPADMLAPEYRMNETTTQSEADAILADLELGGS